MCNCSERDGFVNSYILCLEQDGELVATNEADLHMTSDLTNSRSPTPPDSKATPPPGIAVPSPILESEEPTFEDEEGNVGQSAKVSSTERFDLDEKINS